MVLDDETHVICILPQPYANQFIDDFCEVVDRHYLVMASSGDGMVEIATPSRQCWEHGRTFFRNWLQIAMPLKGGKNWPNDVQLADLLIRDSKSPEEDSD